MTDPLTDDGYDHTADHRLTLYPEQRGTGESYDYIPPKGSCSCGAWSMIGPHPLITAFHNTHLKETAPS